VPERVESLFSLDYLEDMARPIGSDVIVSFRLGTEMPVKFRYQNGEASVQHLLAPRIESS
jgi:proliferating cell nuclear antigen